ncbi:MAG: acyl-CoA dehydrogenase [Gammaproteobacteria bacterium]|nr:acyl-CoA dehydrogenase [Gammaproteobacteria bacterium]
MPGLTETQAMMVATAEAVAQRFGPEYWREHDENEAYPEAFVSALGEHGFFGVTVPEALGGSGQGLSELVLVMEALCRGGGGGGPALGYLFGLLGTMTLAHAAASEDQLACLRALASGEKLCAFALSEPDAGTNSFNMSTTAIEREDDFVINGAKWFITNLQHSQSLLLVAQTQREGSNESCGLSLFMVDLPNESLTFTPTPKHGFNYYKSNQLFIDNLVVPKTAVIGEVGKGFASLAPTLNAERLLVAAGAVGTARLALQSAVGYAKERTVFRVPIGTHQAIQHPLAYGGAGYAREYHQERWWREVQLFRLAPLTQQMTLNFIGQHVLGLPKSY